MMLKMKKTLLLSVLAASVAMTACQPKNADKKSDPEKTQTSASEVPDTSLQLLGNNEELVLNIPECDDKNCPDFHVERLKTNQTYVDEALDQAILKQLKTMLSISEQYNKQNKPADTDKSKQPDQEVPSSTVMGQTAPETPAQILAKQVQPYLDNFLNLDTELKKLGVSHKITLNINPKILNSDGPLVTVVLNSSSYLGGAHGATAQQYFNFDLKKQKQVELKDILAANQHAALENKAHEAFKIWVKDSKLADNVDQYEQSWKFKLSDNFYLGRQGLILQYAEYEIGPYVVGLPRLVIPYEQLQTILKKEYLPEIKAQEIKAQDSQAKSEQAKP